MAVSREMKNAVWYENDLSVGVENSSPVFHPPWESLNVIGST